jgi:glycosyltransferase involved in cell wall biosynthesis
VRILWHSNAPWAPTGYGQQTAIWIPRFEEMGHDMLVSAYYGLHGSPMRYGETTILPGHNHLYGDDILAERYVNEQVDCLITLHDIWVLTPSKLSDLNVAHWLPVDCQNLGSMDRACLEISHAVPIAMSRHGEKTLRDAGFEDVFYVPHGIDTTLFRPSGDRQALREANKINDRFIIGLNAANKDPFRKGIYEQFAAFAKLYHKYGDVILLVHGLATEDNGVDLNVLAKHLGIMQAIKFADSYSYKTGRLTPSHLVNWYSMLDLYSMCSLGEGFGITAVEAMACGVPIAVTNGSAMPEIAGDAGWKVEGENFWNPRHEAEWVKPDVNGIFEVYDEAYQQGEIYQAHKSKTIAQASLYDADRVQAEHWKPTLDALTERFSN